MTDTTSVEPDFWPQVQEIFANATNIRPSYGGTNATGTHLIDLWCKSDSQQTARQLERALDALKAAGLNVRLNNAFVGAELNELPCSICNRRPPYCHGESDHRITPCWNRVADDQVADAMF